MVPLQPGQNPVTLSYRFIECGAGHPGCLWHDRNVALAALAPVRRVLRFDDEVGAVEADRGTASRRIGRQLAAAACGLGLKDAPSILAGMDTQIGLFEYELYIVAPHLLAGAATEGSTAGGDALAHLAGEPIGGEKTVERRGRLDLSFVVAELLHIEIGSDVALGGHRHRDVLQMIGQGKQLRTVAPGNEACERLAELMRRERPCPSLVMAHAVVGGKLANAPVDMHDCDADPPRNTGCCASGRVRRGPKRPGAVR